VPSAQVTPNLSAYPEITQLDLSQARTFDPAAGEKGVIRYTLSAPARVRIRIADAATSGIVWRTLVDWEVRSAGEQSEIWDGRDWHGDTVDPRRVSWFIVAEPQRDLLSASDREILAAARYPEHKHFLHPPESCGDLSVRLSGITNDATVSSSVDLQATLSGKLGMPDGEYHVVVYLDGREAWDGRVSEPRFVQSFDTRNVPNGEHFIAVGFDDLHDHTGSDWVRFTVDNN